MNQTSLKPKLREFRYHSRSESLLLITVGAVFCSLLLYGVLTGTLSPSDNVISGSIICSAVILLTGIWKFLNKKSTIAINENGWKYKIFQKVSQFQFVVIAGLIKSCFILVILSLLYFFHKLPVNTLSVNDIVLVITVYIVLTLWMGYIELLKYKSLHDNE
jgi:hypothetical protein